MPRIRSRVVETESVNQRMLRRGAVKRQHLSRWAVGHDEIAPGVVGDTHLHPSTLEVIREVAGELDANGSGRLLTMSATADSIASGGDTVTFDTIVAQQAFDDVLAPGASWIHPVSGIYVLTFKLAWDDYAGGGTIRVLVNGVSIPEGLIVTGSAGDEAFGALTYGAAAASTGAIEVTQASGSAQVCDALLSVAISDPQGTTLSEQTDSAALETFYFDSAALATPSTMSLDVGQAYTLRITGNFNQGPDSSSPDADTLLYPSPGQPSSTPATNDWENRYAVDTSGLAISHRANSLINMGSGAAHIEARGGPYDGTNPTSGHVYLVDVTGEGSPVTLGPVESGMASDNNGRFKVEIFEGTI